MGIQPRGDDLRRATKWISELRTEDPGASLADLVDKAALKFNLSPSDEQFLYRVFVQGESTG
ncbi:hypothetical protein ACFL0Q_06300 [Thermodesulfobacteriota bacterium]